MLSNSSKPLSSSDALSSSNLMASSGWLVIASVNADKSSNLTRAGHLHQASKGLNSEVDDEVDKFKISSDEKKRCILGTKLPNRENLDKSV